MREKLQARIAEWLLVRQTAALGDVVDEAAFLKLLDDMPVRTLRDWRWRGAVHGIPVPDPIYRPDGLKPIWLKAEAEKFAREIRAIKEAKR